MTAPKLPEGLEPVALPQPIGYLAFQVDDAKPVFFPSMPVLLAGTARWHPGVARIVPVHHADDLHQAQAALQALAAEKHAAIAALKEDAARWRYVRHHWSNAQMFWNNDATNSLKSIVLTVKTAHWTSGASDIEQQLDSALALAAKEAK